LYRWIELEAFGSAMYRSHVGSSISPKNAQIYQDAETMEHFTIFSSIFAHLAPYRHKLMKEASSKGWPLIRTMATHFAYDPKSWELTKQYMFGSDFMIAPVLDPTNSTYSKSGQIGKNRKNRFFSQSPVRPVTVYIPINSVWIYLWTGQVIEGGEYGRYVDVDAPFGNPPVFYKPSSKYGRNLRQYILDNNYDAVMVQESNDNDIDITSFAATENDSYVSHQCMILQSKVCSDESNVIALSDEGNDVSMSHLYEPVVVYQSHLIETDTKSVPEAMSLSSSTSTKDGLPTHQISFDDRSRVGIISDHKEATWLDWFGLSEYTASWESNAWGSYPTANSIPNHSACTSNKIEIDMKGNQILDEHVDSREHRWSSSIIIGSV
jgi:hypothetical protein